MGSLSDGFLGDQIGNITGSNQASAIREGARLNQEQINLGIDELNTQFGATQAQFDPFIEGGATAFQEQLRRATAGPQDLSRSDESLFLQGEADRALLRNAAATGSLGGANTQRALQEQAIGFSSQDLQRQRQNQAVEFNQLGSLSSQGLGFASQLGGLRSNLGSNIANLRSGLGASQQQSLVDQANARAQGTQNLISIGSTAAGFLSDTRLKQDIVPAVIMDGIQYYTWTWNAEGERMGMTGHSFGVLAQEVEMIHPEVIDNEGEYKRVDYNLLTTLGLQ